MANRISTYDNKLAVSDWEDIDILEWEKIFHNNSIKIEFGPTKQIGAEGELFSIYVRDPDENLIEIANRIK